MAREYKKPESSHTKHGMADAERLTHEAFATATVTTIHGGSATLFGSDIGHSDRICISVQRAHVTRDLSRDWIGSSVYPIIEFEMSHAQFAQFITSNGNGTGTPVTLRYAPSKDSKAEMVPGIEKIETKHETFKREIKDASKKRLSAIASSIDKLGDLIATGKAKITDLRAIHNALKNDSEQLPGSMAFVVGSAEEALEKATGDAKIEVEAYITATAQRIGLEQISDLGKLQKLEQKKIGCEFGCSYSKALGQSSPRKCIHCGTPETL
jgi:hypothetical protein